MRALEVEGLSYRKLIVAITVLEEAPTYIKLVTRVSVFRKKETLHRHLFSIACEDVLVRMRRTDQISCTIALIKMRIRD
jgi:hypothetical protein